jgi:hypothetical protein
MARLSKEFSERLIRCVMTSMEKPLTFHLVPYLLKKKEKPGDCYVEAKCPCCDETFKFLLEVREGHKKIIIMGG